MQGPLILNDASGNSYQIAIYDSGQFGYAPVAAQPAQTYLIADPLTATTYVLQSIVLTGPNQGIQYQLAAPGVRYGLTYALFSYPSNLYFQFGVLYGRLVAWQGALLPPKIVYPSGGSNTLLFTRFPREMAATFGTNGSLADWQAARVQNVFSSGAAQVNYWRTDTFFRATMEWVALTDLAAWQAFKDYSLSAGQLVTGRTTSVTGNGNFDLYYTQSSSFFDTYIDDATEWVTTPHKTGTKATQWYTFPLNFRLYVAP